MCEANCGHADKEGIENQLAITKWQPNSEGTI